MKNSSKVVVIVDGYSTGRFLAPFLHKRGYTAIHVQSSIGIPNFFTRGFRPENYDERTIFDGDLLRLVDWLKAYQVLVVFIGAESGVYLGDKLSATLQLLGNTPESSELRRNKFLMIKAVNDGGLETAAQFKSNDVDAILKWHSTEMNGLWPVVIKPINSAGSDSVRFCNNAKELIAATQNILGKKNKLGILNTEVLVQSFLDGEEYVVNTVSCFSKHNLTDIRRCYKKRISGAGYGSACEELLSPNEKISQELKSYAFRALDLLKITHGPGHFEIMYTKKGPKIIEVGARVQGEINPDSNAACLGYQQIDKTIDAYLEPTRFFSYYEKDYTLQKFGLWTFLISEKIGKITSIPFIDTVKTLSSFFSLQMNVQPEDYLVRTIDYYSSPGNVHLVNQDNNRLMEDMAQLRQFESEGFIIEETLS
ncbi:MAG TPA: ATP-grasp domain-containing protein [Gammaproteobacteria bacterium]|nr:ATP-grasp domain-containing protein [Gammaproteobacteria bacterium]